MPPPAVVGPLGGLLLRALLARRRAPGLLRPPGAAPRSGRRGSRCRPWRRRGAPAARPGRSRSGSRVESSDALWLSASAFDFSNSAARGVELFLGDRQVTDEVVVLVGGRRSVLRTARRARRRRRRRGRRRVRRSRHRRRGRRPGPRAHPSGSSERCAAASSRACVSAIPAVASSIASCAWLYCSSRTEMRSSLAAIFACELLRRASASARARPAVTRKPTGLRTRRGRRRRRGEARPGRGAEGAQLRVRANMASQAIGRASRGGGIGRARASAVRRRSASPGWAADRCVRPLEGVVQCWLRASSSATFCHSVGLQPWAAVDEGRVLPKVDKSRQPLEAEAVDEGASGSHEHEPPVGRVAEDPPGDGSGARHAHDGAHVAVAERGEDPLDHRAGTRAPSGRSGRMTSARLKTVVQSSSVRVAPGRLVNAAADRGSAPRRGNLPTPPPRVTDTIGIRSRSARAIELRRCRRWAKPSRSRATATRSRATSPSPKPAPGPACSSSRSGGDSCRRSSASPTGWRERGLHRARARPLPRRASPSTPRWTRPRS